MYQDIYNCICQNTQKIRYIIHYIKLTAQLLFKNSISKRWTNMQEASGKSTTPNAARTIRWKALNSPAEYPSWVTRCGIKGSVSTMLNPIFWKKVQGHKHLGRWGIVKHQIPNIKVLFKTNAKGHKHPSIRLLSKSKTQLVNQRKQKVAFSPGTAHSPEIQSYRTWVGAASPILNDTPVVCVYTFYNKTHIRNAYIYIYIY